MGIGQLGINPDAFGVWVADAPGNVPWQDFLDGAAAAGFEGVELGPWGYLPTDPGMLRDELAARSLDLYCGYLSAPFHEPDGVRAGIAQVHKTAALTKPAGARYIMLLSQAETDASGRVAMSADTWRAMVAGLLEAGRVAAGDYGLEVVFHQHVGMGVETTAETERLISDTHGEISMLLDTGQYTYVGGDPTRFMETHGPLVSYLQLRDIDPVTHAGCIEDQVTFPESCQRGVYCEPGTGMVDFEGLVNAARNAGFSGPAVVERSLLGCTTEEALKAAHRAAGAHARFGFGNPRGPHNPALGR